ncbi:MAG: hypothetical protein ACRDE5_19105, partial [Ginsengibacter sp.]
GIFRPGGRHTPGGYSFLSYICMKKSADLTLHFILLFGGQFKGPDQLHELIPIQVSFLGEFSGHYYSKFEVQR